MTGRWGTGGDGALQRVGRAAAAERTEVEAKETEAKETEAKETGWRRGQRRRRR